MKKPKDKNIEQQNTPIQRVESETNTGGKATIADNRPETVHQRKLMDTMKGGEAPIQQKANRTGLPDNLKSGVESLSGYSMDDVKVHYNSSKPAQLQAHAYAQGADIHVAPGQEKHLPHEAWHVVQQKQGRVKPTKQLKSKVNINDDAGLEKEADVMGAKAMAQPTTSKDNHVVDTKAPEMKQVTAQAKTIQRHAQWGPDIESIRTNGLIKITEGINDNKKVAWHTKDDQIDLIHQGGGAMKSAINVNNDKILLVSEFNDNGVTTKGDAESEVEQLLQYEREMAQIPEFYYDETRQHGQVNREYVFPLYVYDFESDQIDDQLMGNIKNSMGTIATQPNAWGFVQGKMEGVEYGKKDSQKFEFWYRLSRLVGKEAQIALRDLKRIRVVWKEHRWKDFALFMTNDARVRIFDPAPQRLWNGITDHIDPEHELDRMINALEEKLEESGLDTSVNLVYEDDQDMVGKPKGTAKKVIYYLTRGRFGK